MNMRIWRMLEDSFSLDAAHMILFRNKEKKYLNMPFIWTSASCSLFVLRFYGPVNQYCAYSFVSRQNDAQDKFRPQGAKMSLMTCASSKDPDQSAHGSPKSVLCE